MIKGKIIAVMGRTRSGKDSIGTILADRPEHHLIKFASTMKRFVERSYGLPDKAMENPEYRNSLVPGTNKTFLDLMVFSYRSYDEIDPLFWIRKSLGDIEYIVRAGETVILTDLRKPEEVDFIVQLVYSGLTDLHLVVVSRPDVPKIISDASLADNIQKLWGWAVSQHAYLNSKSLDDLQAFAEALDF